MKKKKNWEIFLEDLYDDYWELKKKDNLTEKDIENFQKYWERQLWKRICLYDENFVFLIFVIEDLIKLLKERIGGIK